MLSVPVVPTYREIIYKLRELEREHQILGRRYADLTRQIRKVGKDTVVDKDYYKRLQQMAKDMNEPWDEERVDIIGQNGNDGLHYGEANE